MSRWPGLEPLLPAGCCLWIPTPCPGSGFYRALTSFPHWAGNSDGEQASSGIEKLELLRLVSKNSLLKAFFFKRYFYPAEQRDYRQG